MREQFEQLAMRETVCSLGLIRSANRVGQSLRVHWSGAHLATRSIFTGFLESTMMLPTLEAATESAQDITLLAILFDGEAVLLLVRSISGLLAVSEANISSKQHQTSAYTIRQWS